MVVCTADTTSYAGPKISRDAIFLASELFDSRDVCFEYYIIVYDELAFPFLSTLSSCAHQT